jgi:Family of unknown function (DUF5681)
MSEDPKYKVGYGKPPKHTRFKSGQSGNPKGRKPGSKNVMTLLEETLFSPVKIREKNGKVRRVPAIQAYFLNLRNEAIKGDPKAMDRFFRLATLYQSAQTQMSNAAPAAAVDKAADLTLLQELWRMLQEDPANGISFVSDADSDDCDRNAGDPT